jgi:hypothetical protein
MKRLKNQTSELLHQNWFITSTKKHQISQCKTGEAKKAKEKECKLMEFLELGESFIKNN